MITQHLSINQMKDSMRAPWIAGDFGALAREIGAPEPEGFVARMGLEPDARVLDIAWVRVTLISNEYLAALAMRR